MKKQMIWGLSVLILLIGIAGVFLLIPQDIDTERELVLSEETKKLLEEGSKQQVPGQATKKRQSPGVLPPAHSDGDKLQGELHQLTEVDKALEEILTLTTDSPELKRAKIEAYKEYYRKETGQDLPPIGYYHVKGPDGVVRLNKIGEPYIPIKTGNTQFCPNPEQLKEFERLKQLRLKAWNENNRSEYDRIEAEIHVFKNLPETQGVLPTTGGFSYAGISYQEAIAYATQKLKEAYEERGYGHLWGRDDLGPGPLPPLPFIDSN